MNGFRLVFCTFPDAASARQIGTVLVEKQLAACVNLIPGVESVYRWEGKVADEREVMVVMKSRKQDWPALMSRLHELHPYDTPECVAVRIASGAPKYMAWLESVLDPANP